MNYLLFKQMIVDVFIFANGMVATTDLKGEQMPYFQGKRNEAMPKIKSRIERQMPCTIHWHIQKGATFEGKTFEETEDRTLDYRKSFKRKKKCWWFQHTQCQHVDPKFCDKKDAKGNPVKCPKEVSR